MSFQFEKNLKGLLVSSLRPTHYYGEISGKPYKFAATAISGSVPAGVVPYVVATETGDGVYNQTSFVLTALPITLTAATVQGGGAQIYTFPLGRICRIGAQASIAVTTTSVILDTLNGGATGNYGVGTVTQVNPTVATTEQDIVQVTAWTASTTINVAGAAAAGVGAGVLASLDGRSTAIKAFLNLGIASAGSLDADATVTVTGTVRITWAKIGT